MAKPLLLDAFGVAIELRFPEERARQLRPAIETAWSRCVRQVPRWRRSPAEVVLDVALGEPSDDLSTVAAPSEEQLLEALSQEVTVNAIEQRAGDFLMLHACALADPATGRTLVMVAPSGTGKTTAARVLGASWGYVTDETVAIAEDGALLGYPKPLSVITDAAHKVQLSPDDLGLVRAPEDLSLAGIWLLDRRPDGGEPAFEPVPTVEAVAHLAEQSSYLTFLGEPLQRVAALVQTTGGVMRVTYADAEDLSAPVAEALGERS